MNKVFSSRVCLKTLCCLLSADISLQLHTARGVARQGHSLTRRTPASYCRRELFSSGDNKRRDTTQLRRGQCGQTDRRAPRFCHGITAPNTGTLLNQQQQHQQHTATKDAHVRIKICSSWSPEKCWKVFKIVRKSSRAIGVWYSRGWRIVVVQIRVVCDSKETNWRTDGSRFLRRRKAGARAPTKQTPRVAATARPFARRRRRRRWRWHRYVRVALT